MCTPDTGVRFVPVDGVGSWPWEVLSMRVGCWSPPVHVTLT